MKHLIALLLLAVSLRAEDLYFTQSGSGSHNGTVGNPWSVSEASTSGNWGSGAGKISAGDTLHVVGTITSQLTIQGSGSAGNVITILFDSGAKFSSTCWTTSGAITLTNLSYITIDGGGGALMAGFLGPGSNGNPALANGIVENTANGTGLANAQESCGIYIQEGKHVTIQNLVVQNIYVRTGTTDTVDGGKAIRFADANGNGMSDLLVTNCIIHDAMCGIGPDYGPSDHDYTFSYNTIYNCNWSIVCGGRGGSSTLTNITAHHNLCYGWNVWNDTATNAWHHNGFFTFADGASELVTNPLVYDNFFGPGYGGSYSTSGVYINAHIVNPRIYNNIFYCAPGEYTGNGLITLSSQTATTMLVANNTFVGGGDGTAIQLSGSKNGAAVTMIVKNNVGTGAGGGTYIALYSNSDVTFQTNNNIGYNFSSSLGYSYSTNDSGNFQTFAQWKALGFDTSPGVATDPLLTAIYTLGAGSPAIATGADLSAYFTTDAAGYTRSVPWDIGAYKYLGVSGSISGGSLILGGSASLK